MHKRVSTLSIGIALAAGFAVTRIAAAADEIDGGGETGRRSAFASVSHESVTIVSDLPDDDSDQTLLEEDPADENFENDEALRFAQLMSTCDPANDLSQACCNALSAANTAQSSAQMASAFTTCDSSATTSTSAPPDCVSATCTGPGLVLCLITRHIGSAFAVA
jgi:hypothetical protein